MVDASKSCLKSPAGLKSNLCSGLCIQCMHMLHTSGLEGKEDLVDPSFVPGPFAPPGNSLPIRKITARSYSWTT